MTKIYSPASFFTTLTRSILPRRDRCSLDIPMLIFSTFALIVMPSCLEAAQVMLAWDANYPAPDEYRLYQRLENQDFDYSTPVWHGTSTSCQVNNLQDGASYYFVVRASSQNEESGNSNEVKIETSGNQASEADAGGNTGQSQVVLDGSSSSDSDVDNQETNGDATNGNAGTENGNFAPFAPAIISPLDGESRISGHATFIAGPFDDPDEGDTHGGAQWLIFKADDGVLVLDRTVSRQNLDMLQLPSLVLTPSTPYICMVRYYDNHGTPSSWSDPVSFTTVESNRDKDGNGIPDNQQIGNSCDMNKDGIADSDQETVVKSARSDDGSQFGISILNCENAVAIENIELIDPADFEDRADLAQIAPFNMMGFVILLDQPGQEVSLNIFSSEPLSENSSPWVSFDEVNARQVDEERSTINVDDGSIQYRIEDGGAADADGVANGTIVGLCGPRLVTSGDDEPLLDINDNSTSGDAKGSGGSSTGCFIESLPHALVW